MESIKREDVYTQLAKIATDEHRDYKDSNKENLFNLVSSYDEEEKKNFYMHAIMLSPYNLLYIPTEYWHKSGGEIQIHSLFFEACRKDIKILSKMTESHINSIFPDLKDKSSKNISENIKILITLCGQNIGLLEDWETFMETDSALKKHINKIGNLISYAFKSDSILSTLDPTSKNLLARILSKIHPNGISRRKEIKNFIEQEKKDLYESRSKLVDLDPVKLFNELLSSQHDKSDREQFARLLGEDNISSILEVLKTNKDSMLRDENIEIKNKSSKEQQIEALRWNRMIDRYTLDSLIRWETRSYRREYESSGYVQYNRDATQDKFRRCMLTDYGSLIIFPKSKDKDGKKEGKHYAKSSGNYKFVDLVYEIPYNCDHKTVKKMALIEINYVKRKDITESIYQELCDEYGQGQVRRIGKNRFLVPPRGKDLSSKKNINKNELQKIFDSMLKEHTKGKLHGDLKKANIEVGGNPFDFAKPFRVTSNAKYSYRYFSSDCPISTRYIIPGEFILQGEHKNYQSFPFKKYYNLITAESKNGNQIEFNGEDLQFQDVFALLLILIEDQGIKPEYKNKIDELRCEMIKHFENVFHNNIDKPMPDLEFASVINKSMNQNWNLEKILDEHRELFENIGVKKSSTELLFKEDAKENILRLEKGALKDAAIKIIKKEEPMKKKESLKSKAKEKKKLQTIRKQNYDKKKKKKSEEQEKKVKEIKKLLDIIKSVGKKEENKNKKDKKKKRISTTKGPTAM